MYLGWYDDSIKKAVANKISEAMAAYEDRFGTLPNVVLVNEQDIAQVEGVTIVPRPYIRRNNFWVGFQQEPPRA